MEDQFGKVTDKEIIEELKRKKTITLANTAVDEVKVFLRVQLHFISLMYKEAFLDEEDFTISLHEDLVKLIVNVIFSDELYKLLILLYRVDNFDFDKDLRLKYHSMKGVKTTDFAIDPYLSLADPLVVMKEASKRYGLSTIETTSEQYTNPTV